MYKDYKKTAPRRGISNESGKENFMKNYVSKKQLHGIHDSTGHIVHNIITSVCNTAFQKILISLLF